MGKNKKKTTIPISNKKLLEALRLILKLKQETIPNPQGKAWSKDNALLEDLQNHIGLISVFLFKKINIFLNKFIIIFKNKIKKYNDDNILITIYSFRHHKEIYKIIQECDIRVTKAIEKFTILRQNFTSKLPDVTGKGTSGETKNKIHNLQSVLEPIISNLIEIQQILELVKNSIDNKSVSSNVDQSSSQLFFHDYHKKTDNLIKSSQEKPPKNASKKPN